MVVPILDGTIDSQFWFRIKMQNSRLQKSIFIVVKYSLTNIFKLLYLKFTPHTKNLNFK